MTMQHIYDAVMAYDEEEIPKLVQAELEAGTVGLDALFTLAGLHSFAKDQAALDDRIRKLLG